MRKTLIRALDLSSLLLLACAALIGWRLYQPEAATPPADVTIVDDGLGVSARERVNAEPVTPFILPETKSADQRPPEDAPSLSDRRINLQTLQEFRQKTFPPPAHSLPERIVMPAIGVDSAVLEVGWKVTQQNGQAVAEWEVADYAVGFHHNSALPGASGNTVMTGHNNINGEVFRNLIDLKIGDEVMVYADHNLYRYLVAQKLLVKESGASMDQRIQNAEWIAPTDDVRLTLISCWPYSSNTHRIIIVALPAPPDAE